jgi:hypothetical protein
VTGRVTTKHLLTHARVIIQEFGWGTYYHAWGIALRGGGTFLEAAMKSGAFA